MKLTVKPKLTRKLTDGELPYGAYSQIGRRMRPQVSAQHVREVFLGNRRSPRVEQAIQRFREQMKESA